ncbi:hypothetical protein FKM82_025102 [Ascaphus truei]
MVPFILCAGVRPGFGALGNLIFFFSLPLPYICIPLYFSCSSPHENRKKKHSKSQTKSKARSGSPSYSPSKQGANRSAVHSASVSPMESRGSSQERYRGVSQDKDGHIVSDIASSVQSKITQVKMDPICKCCVVSIHHHCCRY